MKMTKDKLKLINDAIKRVSKHERTSEPTEARGPRPQRSSPMTVTRRDPLLNDLFASPALLTLEAPEPSIPSGGHAGNGQYTFTIPREFNINAEALMNQPGQVIAVEEAESFYNRGAEQLAPELRARIDDINQHNQRRIAEIANGPSPEELQRRAEVELLRNRYIEEMNRITRTQQEMAMPRWEIAPNPNFDGAIAEATRDALVLGEGMINVDYNPFPEDDEEYNGN